MRSQKPLIEKTLKLFFSIRTIAQLNCDQNVIVSMLDLQLKGSKIKPHLVTNDCQCQSQNYKIIPYWLLCEKEREKKCTIKNRANKPKNSSPLSYTRQINLFIEKN